MRRVLLVDDESFIRKGIRTIIERSQMDYKDISECWNGQEALEKILSERFDLVILDIRMPGMDGITFLKEAQKFEYKPKFIILSGYNDFQYAAGSMKYGAREYLLKPVQRDELIEALKKVEEELQREEQIDNQSRKVGMIIDRFRASELNSLLIGVSYTEQQIENTFDVSEIDIITDSYRIALVKRLDILNCGENDSTFLKTLIEKHLDELDIPFLDTIRDDGTIAIVLGRQIAFEEMIRYIKEQLGGEYVVGISDTGEGFMDIRKMFLQASEALKYRVFASTDKVICFSDICRLNQSYKIPVELMKKIPDMIGTNRIREMDEIIGEIFNAEALHKNNITYLEDIIENINRYIIAYFFEHLPQKAHSMKKQFEAIKNIYNFKNIDEYLHTLRNCIIEINSFYLTLKNLYKKSNKIDAAIAYISENFHKDISMTVVANYVSINYTNFSIMFSGETGMSFVDFLRQVRIDKARELIRTTEYKINEISEIVGFKNPKHFAKSFKLVTGVSPVEFRNKQ